MDAICQSGRPLGALHGVPVGLKDIIDTKDYPTERGTPIFAGRRPDQDAAVVEHLRDAGAVILGKTKTTEVAFVHPTDTLNPHNLDYFPGGSSSGSAAAVAAHQVPLALGTQTNGSVIRPASFCGTYGFQTDPRRYLPAGACWPHQTTSIRSACLHAVLKMPLCWRTSSKATTRLTTNAIRAHGRRCWRASKQN